jgi:hypothetical protein
MAVSIEAKFDEVKRLSHGQQREAVPKRQLIIPELLAAAFLAACLGLFVMRTLDWPLVNDAALIHYICFLMDHGRSPYRDIVDINMPGAYAVDWAVMHTLGSGDLAWRIFDFSLLGVAVLAMLTVAGRRRWFAGIFAGTLFGLFHGRDGIGQAGQRDLTAAVFLLSGYALLSCARACYRWKPLVLFFFSGCCIGCAASIKPPALLFGFALFPLAAAWMRHEPKFTALFVGAAGIGVTIPILLLYLLLVKEHAVSSFVEMLRVTLPYHASLGRRSVGYMFTWSAPVAIWVMAAIALGLCLARRGWRTWETQSLLTSAVAGLVFYFVQDKGFVYHRYPLIAFLLLWISLEFTGALDEGGRKRLVGSIGLAFGLILAPLYLVRATKATWDNSFAAALQSDLGTLGGQRLAGKVQCIDSISGCITTLYRMRLVQSSGEIYDEFLFGPRQSKTLQENEAKLVEAFQIDPPNVIVVSRWLFNDGPDNYLKLAMWPEFEEYLSTNYRLYNEREFKGAETGPVGYRIYVKRLGHSATKTKLVPVEHRGVFAGAHADQPVNRVR